MIIDFHAHIFEKVNGKNFRGKTYSAQNGMIQNGGVYSQFIPSKFENTSFSYHDLIALMDDNNIDKALLLQNPTIGVVNNLIVEALDKYSDRFWGVIQVDPMDKSACEKIVYYSQNLNMVALKLEMSYDWGWTGIYPGLDFSSKQLKAIVRQVDKEGLALIIDTGDIGKSGYQIDLIRNIAHIYPQMPIVIEHLGYMTLEAISEKEKYCMWNSLLQLGKMPNVYFGVSAGASLLNDPYPFPHFQRLLKKAIKEIGTEKLIWGSDIPVTFNKYTYQEMMDTILSVEFLNDNQKQKIMGDNALDIISKIITQKKERFKNHE